MADLNLKWRNKLVTLVILISMCFAQDEYTLLKPKNELKNQTIPNLTDYKYYKFVVDSFFNNKKDIAISTTLTEDNPWANPDIYLAKDIQKPNVTNFQIACNSFGEDICTINKNELKANETWYLGVNCGGTNSRGKTCSYDISMEYIDEIIIEDGVSVTVYLYTTVLKS